MVKDKAFLLRPIVPALIAGILYALLFYLSVTLFFDPNGSWTTIVLFCAGVVAAFVFGVVSKSIGTAILRGFLFGFVAMILFHLVIWAFTDFGSFGDVFSWGLMYAIVMSIAGMLLSTIGYGAKRLFQDIRSKNRQA